MPWMQWKMDNCKIWCNLAWRLLSWVKAIFTQYTVSHSTCKKQQNDNKIETVSLWHHWRGLVTACMQGSQLVKTIKFKYLSSEYVTITMQLNPEKSTTAAAWRALTKSSQAWNCQQMCLPLLALCHMVCFPSNSTQSEKLESTSKYLHLPCQPQVQKLLCAQVPFVQVRILQKKNVEVYLSYHVFPSENSKPCLDLTKYTKCCPMVVKSTKSYRYPSSLTLTIEWSLCHRPFHLHFHPWYSLPLQGRYKSITGLITSSTGCKKGTC